MDRDLVESEACLENCVEALNEAIGHAGRFEVPESCCGRGLAMPLERKSAGPAAGPMPVQWLRRLLRAGFRPGTGQLLHFVARPPWPDDEGAGRVQALVLPPVGRGRPIKAGIVDGTGLLRKGKHSASVARQSCGRLGKQDNGQAAAGLPLANDTASLPAACRPYLTRPWADDPQMILGR